MLQVDGLRHSTHALVCPETDTKSETGTGCVSAGSGVVSKVGNGAPAPANKLYFGDNLEVLREYVPDGSVDLVYLDPPFNSQARYNVLFQSPKSDSESAQAQAFRDSWTWLEDAQESYARKLVTA